MDQKELEYFENCIFYGKGSYKYLVKILSIYLHLFLRVTTKNQIVFKNSRFLTFE